MDCRISEQIRDFRFATTSYDNDGKQLCRVLAFDSHGAKSLHASLHVNSLLGTFIRDSRGNKLSTACPSFLVLRVCFSFPSLLGHLSLGQLVHCEACPIFGQFR